MPSWDAIVIGAGPAGSSVATYLAREGHRVLALERESFPREHIGESLLPGVLPYLDALGARDLVEAAGFERKEGQTFVWGRDRTPWELDFRALDVHPYAFFVDRARFDHLLLRHAETHGAVVREKSAVRRVLFEDGRAVGVAGDGFEEHARFVVDASGQSALVARGAGMRRVVRGLKNLAFWAYWEDAARLPGHKRAHILTVSIPEGWIWVIPLGARTSIGVVTSAATRARRGELGVEEWYTRVVKESEPVAALLRDARRVTDVRSAKDWSYASKRTSGPGIFLAGDAACFIDPILSTGVHLAMTSGYWAASCVHSALREPRHEPLLRRFYDQTYRRVYRELLTQVKAFYRAGVAQESVYWTSRRVLRLGEAVRSDLAFLFITAGLMRNAAIEEPHDVAAQVHRALGENASVAEGFAAAWAHTRRSGRRRDVSPPLVWRAGGSELVTLRAEGLRLIPVRHRPAGAFDRPRGTYFVQEIEHEDAWPAALITFEAIGRTFDVISYGHLSASIVEELIARSATVRDGGSIASVRRALRRVELPAGLSFAKASALRGGGLDHPDLTVVLADPAGRRVYFTFEARLPPDVVDVPVLRTPRLDVWVRPTVDEAGVRAIVDRLRAALRPRGRTSLARAFTLAEEAFGAIDLGPLRMIARGRLGAGSF